MVANESKITTPTPLLTKEERKIISDLIESLRWEMNYNSGKDEKDKGYTIGASTESWISWIREEFNGMKANKRDEQQEEMELLGENINRVLERIEMGIDDWEDLELIKSIEFWQEEAACHLDAIDNAAVWNKRKWNFWEDKFSNDLKSLQKQHQETLHQKLKEEKEKAESKQSYLIKSHELTVNQLNKELLGKSNDLELKSRDLEETNITVGELREKVRKLEEDSEKKAKDLEEANQIILDERSEKKELQNQLHLATKFLPSLPKKQNKFKQLETKIKTKFQRLIKRKKHQKQELFARTEVKTK